jgi:hypothetical protein
MLATDNQTEPSTPPWPSLYDPLIEFYNLPHRDPIQPGGHYLKHAGGWSSWLLFVLPPEVTDTSFEIA